MNIREEQRIERYNQILSVALDEFISKGYYGTSTREISKKASISSGLMFHYFENKEALYLALIKIGCEKMELFSNYKISNPYLFLNGMLTYIFKELQSNLFFAKMFVFMNNAQYMPHVSKQVNELLLQHDVITQSIPLISKGQSMGQFKKGDAHALSMAFWCSIQGIAQEYARNPMSLPDVEWVMDIILK